MDVWEWTPLIALIVLAGLASLPGPVIEAAAIDGASYWKRLRHIVLPMIAGVVVVALLVRSMDAIRYFDIITNTTNGGPADATKIVPIRLYETAFRFFDLGYAAAIGLSMLAVIDPHGEPLPAHAQAKGAGAMSGRRIGVRALIGVVLLWTLVPLLWMVLSSFKPSVARSRRRRPCSPSRRRSSTTTRCSPAATTSARYIGQLDPHGRRSRRSSPWRSDASPATGSRGAASAARTTWRSGSSRPAWRRSPPSCCRCSSSSGSPACSGRRPGWSSPT